MAELKIGTLLRRLRDVKKRSTREIAERIGVSQSTYVDWENERSSPSIRNYLSLAQAFEMTPVELMAYLIAPGNCGQTLPSDEIARINEKLEHLLHEISILSQDREEMKMEIKTIHERLAILQPQTQHPA